jgi:hypothetical protein
MVQGPSRVELASGAEMQTRLREITDQVSRVAADPPGSHRTELEVLRTDTPTFTAYVQARRNRREEWFKVPAGRIDVCNVTIVARPRNASTSK